MRGWRLQKQPSWATWQCFFGYQNNTQNWHGCETPFELPYGTEMVAPIEITILTECTTFRLGNQQNRETNKRRRGKWNPDKRLSRCNSMLHIKVTIHKLFVGEMFIRCDNFINQDHQNKLSGKKERPCKLIKIASTHIRHERHKKVTSHF